MTKPAKIRESDARRVRIATRADEASVTDVITLGFSADPMARWSFPEVGSSPVLTPMSRKPR